jgi:uncharacterized membrane protein
MALPMSAVFLVAASFLASSVEMVEALTIVLAVGVSREWRSTLVGVVSALIVLAGITLVLGPTLALIPIDALRVVVGALLLVFGLQWLRKAILRASGYKALHDETLIYQRELEEARSARTEIRAGMDWYAFTLSFKGVFLEGLEVIFIVLTFGASQGSVALAAIGAAAAVILVGIIGIAVHQPLSRVPENSMKFVVGCLLTTFGAFWAGEGVGIAWPGEDVAILGILAFVFVLGLLGVAVLQRSKAAEATTPVVAAVAVDR